MPVGSVQASENKVELKSNAARCQRTSAIAVPTAGSTQTRSFIISPLPLTSPLQRPHCSPGVRSTVTCIVLKLGAKTPPATASIVICTVPGRSPALLHCSRRPTLYQTYRAPPCTASTHVDACLPAARRRRPDLGSDSPHRWQRECCCITRAAGRIATPRHRPAPNKFSAQSGKPFPRRASLHSLTPTTSTSFTSLRITLHSILFRVGLHPITIAASTAADRNIESRR